MKMGFVLCAVAAVLVIAPGCKKKTPIAVVPAPRMAPLPPSPQITEPQPPVSAPPNLGVSEARSAPPVTIPVIPSKSLAERLATEVADAYFEFDKSDLRDDARFTLTKDADELKQILTDFSNTTVIIEGHCDERGSAEYNIGLGDQRAHASKEFLIQVGLDGQRFVIVSYGKERPQCTESNKDCWQRNRRVHFVPGEAQRSGNE